MEARCYDGDLMFLEEHKKCRNNADCFLGSIYSFFNFDLVVYKIGRNNYERINIKN